MRTAALIPAYNDDYCLDLCLRSVVPFFTEIHVFNDRSTDLTGVVADAYERRWPHVHAHHNEGEQMGWVQVRNALAECTTARHLFWIDADDVLCEFAADRIKEYVRHDRRFTWLRLTEMWGDFAHTTKRLKHYDKCHMYMDRKGLPSPLWGGAKGAKPLPADFVRKAFGRNPMFFHIKGLKPDRRLVERQWMRTWLKIGQEKDLAAVSKVETTGKRKLHRRAMRMILGSVTDRIRPTYRGNPDALPQRPQVILDRLPGRFEITYAEGKPVDRVDHWQGREQETLLDSLAHL